jgi:hypothetical protein
MGALLGALANLACTSLGAADQASSSAPTLVQGQTPAGDCPYLRVFVGWQRGRTFDEDLQATVAKTFSAFLSLEGFQVVQNPDDAEWWSSSTAMRSIQNPDVLVWAVDFQRQPQIIEGSAPRIGDFIELPDSSDLKALTDRANAGTLGTYSILGEVPVADLPKSVEVVAWAIGTVFRGYAMHLCSDLEMALREEELKLEELREELAEEIRRVRRELAEEQQKKLKLEVQPPTTP